ncbi:reverse transcriptase domain-containing protein [Tanacetum coccineum]
MASSLKKFKCILHFDDTEQSVIMYDDMTYSLLVEMVMKKFNFDPTNKLNLSVNLPSLESQLDITNDEDVKFFVDCASSSTGEGKPHLKITEDASKDDHFIGGPWLRAVVYLHAEGVMATGCLGDMKKYFKDGKLKTVVGVIMSCTPNALGYLTVTMKDPSGTMGGKIHYKVFEKDEAYAKTINARAVLILRNVSVFSQKPSKHYLNITLRNIVMVFN